MIIIDLDPLMTNMTVFRSSVTYFAVKIMKITVIWENFAHIKILVIDIY